MINKIIKTPIKMNTINYKMYKNLIKIWIYNNIKEEKILKRRYWSADQAYGEYSQEEGQRILILAETDFNQAFEIVASWEKEKSLPE